MDGRDTAQLQCLAGCEVGSCSTPLPTQPFVWPGALIAACRMHPHTAVSGIITFTAQPTFQKVLPHLLISPQPYKAVRVHPA
jgi:hypothetical protein